ncbi:hypothetical protein SAXI111661_20015 [Saccharomonospora xinjiangensis]
MPELDPNDPADENRATKSGRWPWCSPAPPRSAASSASVPSTLAASAARNSPGVSSSMVRSSNVIAEWTTPWTAPNRRAVQSSAARTAPASATSARRCSTVPPSRRMRSISARCSAVGSVLLSQTTVARTCRARCLVSSTPMPPVPPTTTYTPPSRNGSAGSPGTGSAGTGSATGSSVRTNRTPPRTATTLPLGWAGSPSTAARRPVIGSCLLMSTQDTARPPNSAEATCASPCNAAATGLSPSPLVTAQASEVTTRSTRGRSSRSTPNSERAPVSRSVAAGSAACSRTPPRWMTVSTSRGRPSSAAGPSRRTTVTSSRTSARASASSREDSVASTSTGPPGRSAAVAAPAAPAARQRGAYRPRRSGAVVSWSVAAGADGAAVSWPVADGEDGAVPAGGSGIQYRLRANG